LLKTSTTRDFVEYIIRKRTKAPSYHAIGNSFLLIEEEKHGTEIYKKLIHNDVSFLKL